MIKRLQALRARRGFTIIELIVVIAIIGVMMAIIFPMISSDRSRKQEANSAARDFYVAVQSVMTKYSMYEGPLSPLYETNPDLGEMKYFEKLGGNYPYVAGSTAADIPNTTSLYIALEVDGGDVGDIHTYAIEASAAGYGDGEGLYQVCDNSATANINTEFGRLLKAEIEDRISYQDGVYYAKVTYKNTMTSTIPARMEAETVKVEYTGYQRFGLPDSAGVVLTTYANRNFYFAEDNKLASGDIFGVCAPYDSSTGKTVGMIGTKMT